MTKHIADEILLVYDECDGFTEPLLCVAGGQRRRRVCRSDGVLARLGHGRAGAARRRAQAAELLARAAVAHLALRRRGGRAAAAQPGV